MCALKICCAPSGWWQGKLSTFHGNTRASFSALEQQLLATTFTCLESFTISTQECVCDDQNFPHSMPHGNTRVCLSERSEQHLLARLSHVLKVPRKVHRSVLIKTFHIPWQHARFPQCAQAKLACTAATFTCLESSMKSTQAPCTR